MRNLTPQACMSQSAKYNMSFGRLGKTICGFAYRAHGWDSCGIGSIPCCINLVDNSGQLLSRQLPSLQNGINFTSF